MIKNTNDILMPQTFDLEVPLEDTLFNENHALNKLLTLDISKSPGPDSFHPRLSLV